jgi:hypothetical protein
MVQRSYENRWWFVLLGDRIVAAIAAMSLAPAIYAIWLARQSCYLASAAVGVAWFILDSILLIALHNRRIVRLAISLPCTLVVLVAGFAVAVSCVVTRIRSNSRFDRSRGVVSSMCQGLSVGNHHLLFAALPRWIAW